MSNSDFVFHFHSEYKLNMQELRKNLDLKLLVVDMVVDMVVVVVEDMVVAEVMVGEVMEEDIIETGMLHSIVMTIC